MIASPATASFHTSANGLVSRNVSPLSGRSFVSDKGGASQNLPKILRFRNGLLVVKPRFHIQRSLARRASAPFIAP